jgi:hypothetical protein
MPTHRQIKNLQGITDPLIRKRYLKYFQLPQDLRQTIFSVETAEKLNKIAEKNSLDKNQLWWASYITGMILLGETNIVNFVKALQEKCRLDKESARQLARDINQAVFLPVKESLKKIHRVPEWPRENEAASLKPEPAEANPEPNGPKINGNLVDLKGE